MLSAAKDRLCTKEQEHHEEHRHVPEEQRGGLEEGRFGLYQPERSHAVGPRIEAGAEMGRRGNEFPKRGLRSGARSADPPAPPVEEACGDFHVTRAQRADETVRRLCAPGPEVSRGAAGSKSGPGIFTILIGRQPAPFS